MVTRKKTTKTTKTTSTPNTEKKVEFSPERRLTVSVGMSAEYGQIKVGLALSENVKDSVDPLELSDEIFEKLADKLGEQFDKLADLTEYEEGSSENEDVEDDDFEEEDEDVEDDDFEEEDEDVEDDDFEEEDEDEDPDDISPDDIATMKKTEILKLIKDEELDVDPKEFKKIAELREAVINELFETEEEPEDDEDSDWEDDEWEDD